MAPVSSSGSVGDVRVAVSPGDGRLARFGCALLFVPGSRHGERAAADGELFECFRRGGPTTVRTADRPRCILDWTPAEEKGPGRSGHLSVDSNLAVWVQRPDSSEGFVTLDQWIAHRPDVADGRLVLVSDPSIDTGETSTDLRDGDIYAGGFGLVLPHEPYAISLEGPRAAAPSDDATADPQQFDELTDLDVTLAPSGPITYPDDDAERTSRRAADIRCPGGHANSTTNGPCRVCGDPLDATARRSDRRVSSAAAGLRLPNGAVIPINGSIVVGRSPTADGARLDDVAHLVRVESTGNRVENTHLVPSRRRTHHRHRLRRPRSDRRRDVEQRPTGPVGSVGSSRSLDR